MNHKIFAYALFPILSVTMLGPGMALASEGSHPDRPDRPARDERFERELDREHKEDRERRGEKFGLIPDALRAELKEDFQNLTEEGQAQLKEERKALMQDHRADMEDFTGLTREEKKELLESGGTIGDVLVDQGKTLEDARDFLTGQATELVDHIVGWYDLGTEPEQVLRDRITDFVENILNRWFGFDAS